MRWGRTRLLVAAISFGGLEPASAQEAVPVVTAPAPAPCCRIPAGTTVEIEIVDPQSSNTSQIGAMFAIRLAEPLVIDGHTVLPSGAPGQGQVIHAAKSRWAGKAGELILAARFVEADGTRLPLRAFSYGPSAGESRHQTAFIATSVLVVGAFIKGGQVEIPAGTRAHALTSAEVLTGALAAPSGTTQNSSIQGEQK